MTFTPAKLTFKFDTLFEVPTALTKGSAGNSGSY